MANEVIVKVRVLNTALSPVENRPVMLLNPDTDANPFAPAPTTVLFSGNSDANGVALFSSVPQGTYDIKVVNASGNSIYSYGYQVKNSYVVDPGGSSQAAESRFAVRSGEHIQGVSAGIIARRADNPMGTMYSNFQWSKQSISTGGVNVGQENAAPLIQGTGTGTNQFQNQFDGSVFTTSLPLEGKISGLSYYHDNQNLVNAQRVDLVLR